MRVLFWSELFWPYIGGAELFSARLLVALRDRGYEFIVVTRLDDHHLPHEDSYQGIPIYRFPLWFTFDNHSLDQVISVRRQIKELKRRFAPDLIHLHCVGPSVLFHLETTKDYSAPVVLTLVNERPPQGTDSEVFKQTLQAADWVCTKSAKLLSQTREVEPTITPRSSFIYNGLDLPSLLPAPIQPETPTLLCLGRLAPQKGFDLALRAFAEIVKRFPSVRMIMAGDGPERAKLEQLIGDLGLRDFVNLIGWVNPDQVLPLINSVTIVVMPSRWEGLPNVALEAAMMARPVIGTRVGGIPECVVHEETGLLVEPENIQALAQALEFLLDHPETLVKMGLAARERAEKTFSMATCLEAYDALYKKLIKVSPLAHAS